LLSCYLLSSARNHWCGPVPVAPLASIQQEVSNRLSGNGCEVANAVACVTKRAHRSWFAICKPRWSSQDVVDAGRLDHLVYQVVVVVCVLHVRPVSRPAHPERHARVRVTHPQGLHDYQFWHIVLFHNCDRVGNGVCHEAWWSHRPGERTIARPAGVEGHHHSVWYCLTFEPKSFVDIFESLRRACGRLSASESKKHCQRPQTLNHIESFSYR